MRSFLNHILLFLITFLIFTSCALFKPKCPIPNCNIAKEHKHNLVFDRKAMKENKKKRKAAAKKRNEEPLDSLEENFDETLVSDPTDTTNEQLSNTLGMEGEAFDTTQTVIKKKKRKKRSKKESNANTELGSEDSEESQEGDLVGKPKKKKKSKKKKNEEEEEEELDEATLEAMSVGSDTAAIDNKVGANNQLSKKEIKRIKKETEAAMSDSEKQAQFAEKEINKNWRSRITAWFKKNQNPKIGEHWKGPIKRKKTPDYRVWPAVRIWPFTKEKDYTKY